MNWSFWNDNFYHTRIAMLACYKGFWASSPRISNSWNRAYFIPLQLDVVDRRANRPLLISFNIHYCGSTHLVITIIRSSSSIWHSAATALSFCNRILSQWWLSLRAALFNEESSFNVVNVIEGKNWTRKRKHIKFMFKRNEKEHISNFRHLPLSETGLLNISKVNRACVGHSFGSFCAPYWS